MRRCDCRAPLRRQTDHQPPLVDLVLADLDETARLQPVDDALDGRRIHGDQRAELVLRGFADIAELGERRELRRRQVGDMRGEDRDMALVRLAQDEADLLLQAVLRRRSSATSVRRASRRSPQPVPGLDVASGKPAHAVMDARAAGHHQAEQDLVGARPVADADLHGVEMAAHIGGVDMAERHVEPAPKAPTFLADGTIALASPSLSRMA